MHLVRGVTVATALMVLASQPAQAEPLASPPDTMAERVLACAPCHGAQGEGTRDPYFPRLAGKPAGYLFNQLVAFRNGRRHYPPMNYLLAYLPEAYLKDMAEYLASLNPPLPPPAVPSAGEEVLATGRRLSPRATHRATSRPARAAMAPI